MFAQMIQDFLTKKESKQFEESFDNLARITKKIASINQDTYNEIFGKEKLPPEYYIPMIENISFITVISVIQSMAKDETSYKFLIEKSKEKFERLTKDSPYDENV